MQIEKQYTVESRGQGHPDYAKAVPVGQSQSGKIFTINDSGELAARLGALSRFDRRGNVVWQDDFNSGLDKWQNVGVTWDGNCSDQGGFSAKFTMATPGFSAYMWKEIYPFMPDTLAGCEIAASFDSHVTVVSMSIRHVEAGVETLFTWDYKPATNSFVILNDLGASPQVATLALSQSIYTFNYFKLVVDLTNLAYERLVCAGHEYDLSLIKPLQRATALTGTYDYVFIQQLSTIAAEGYVDNLILTQNEPRNI